nr:YiiX/YebB-like N1pC/P60 family cysteine hydrolase [Pseudomonas kitaguniensis]
MKPGDIVFTSEESLTSKTIRNFTGGNYSHVMLCIGYGACIHADKKGGVHSFNVQRLLAERPDQIALKRYSPCLSAETLSIIDRYARLKIGTTYSIWDAVKAAPLFKKEWFKSIKIDLERPSSLQFCSRLVAQAYCEAGIDLAASPFSCTPANIFDCTALTLVEKAVIRQPQELITLVNDESKNTIKIHTDTISKLLEQVRKRYGSTIQTLHDLEALSIMVEGADDIVSRLTAKSGYLDLWKIDIEENPWRYEKCEFESWAVNEHERAKIAQQELGMAQHQLNRHLESLYITRENYKNYPNKTFGQLIALYETLVYLAEKKVNLFSHYQQPPQKKP